MLAAPRRVAIIGSARIPFARSNTAYRKTSNVEMLTAAVKALVDKFKLQGEIIGEVAAGALIKHARDWNLSREAVLGSGLHPQTPAYDVQRACGTSLTTVIQMAHRIALGEIETAIAHEAFAAQVLCTLKAWESEEYCRSKLKRKSALGAIDRGKLNPKGSSVALGHPFAATGARIVGTLSKQLEQRGSGRGLISICTAGGMGVSAVLEN